jgi:hypothetical protein
MSLPKWTISNSKQISSALGSIWTTNIVIFIISIAQVSLTTRILHYAIAQHLFNLSFLNASSLWYDSFQSILKGMLFISVPLSSLPWQFYLLFCSVRNYQNGIILCEPPYHAQLNIIQQQLTRWFCSTVSEIQIYNAFESLRGRIPNELIWKILDFNILDHNTLDCHRMKLEHVDHGKRMVSLYSLLSPQYLIIAQKNIWIMSFSKEVFLIGLFIVGYSSLLKYIWSL